MKVKSAVIFTAIFLIYFSVRAQQPQKAGITMEQTIDYLNKKLGNNFKIELIKKKQMIVTFYKNGRVYKIDKVYIETLDTNDIKYNEEEKMLILHCKDEKELTGNLKKFIDGCVEREIPDKDMTGAYARINLEVGSDEKKIASLRKAFIHLIKLEQDEEYNSSVPFE